jgi:hypothetical protein
VRHVAGRQSRRKSSFDFAAKRRSEIVLHARYVSAADTEDFGRWLIAWALHNPGAKDQPWSLMQAAQRMGGQITEAAAIAIADEAAEIPHCWKADRLAKCLGVTYAQRQQLGLTTIGSVDIGKRARKELRKRRTRLRKKRMRRARGMRPQSESLSATRPWRELGMSRSTWYRRNKPGTSPGTTLSAAIFLSCEDRPVPLARGATGLSERGFASREARCPAKRGAPKAQYQITTGHPSSQTATTLAADGYGSLPIELRLLALGLPLSISDENFAAVA